ncbi:MULTISPECIES: hypothetical protein [Rhodopirellula]|uniref:hypothetical protein n=1 Tax=Rhodopirellula TaxID=265488 RepID=UPI001E449CF7|nr:MULTISPECIES: hypothetical protein [Rhodopirellula]
MKEKIRRYLLVRLLPEDLLDAISGLYDLQTTWLDRRKYKLPVHCYQDVQDANEILREWIDEAEQAGWLSPEERIDREFGVN